MKILIALGMLLGIALSVIANDDGQSVATDGTKIGHLKPNDDELRKRLTDLQYEVTQNDSTERAFRNEYWDNKQKGIYVDIVSGEALFSSTHKYKSGTGWPSFYRAIDDDNIYTKDDHILIYKRTELRSVGGDSHLGHLFEDGPDPTGLRYCINSASLRFIPLDEMKEEGYEEYLGLFADTVGADR